VKADSTVITDSSVITVKYFEDLNSIRVFNDLKNKKLTYYQDYYYDTKSIREQGVYNDGCSIGIWKLYSPTGVLESITDFDKGVWTVINEKYFSFYATKLKMRRIADSLVQAMYGSDFFNKHIIFDLDQSGASDDERYNFWTMNTHKKPKEFMMRYNIRLDSDTLYRDLIEFKLDAHGHFMPDAYEKIYGFQKLLDTIPPVFRLTYNSALEMAEKNGLVETDTSKAEGFLRWENFGIPEIYDGRFWFYIIQKIKTEETCKYPVIRTTLN